MDVRRNLFAFLACCLATSVMAADVQYTFSGTNYPSLGAAEAAMRAANPNWASSLHVCSVANGANLASITYCTSPQAAQYWISNYYSPAISSPGCSATTGPYVNYCNSEGMLVSALSLRAADGTTTCLVGQSESGYYASSPNSWTPSYYTVGGSNFYFADASFYSGYSTSRWVTFETRACSASSGAPTSPKYYELRLDEAFQCPTGFTPDVGTPLAQFPFVCKGGSVTIVKHAAENVTSCPHTAHPCAPATGEKLLTETDFTWRGHPFTRMYASEHETPATAGMGTAWSHGWADYLIPPVPSPTPTASWRNGRNDLETFAYASGSSTTMLSKSTPGRTLQKETDGTWLLSDTSTTVRHFNAAGQLIGLGDVNDPTGQLTFAYNNGQIGTVTDGTGRQLTFGYSNGLLSSVTDDAGTALATYGYDTTGRLTTATYPGGKSRTYSYGEADHLCINATGSCQASYFPNALTGVTDESNRRVLDATYDESGQVLSSTQPTGSSSTTLAYPAASNTTVTQSGQGTVAWTFTTDPSRRPLTRIVHDGARLVSTETWVYGAGNSYVTYTGPTGAITRTTYNAAGLESTRIEAQGLPEQRTITTTWSTDDVPQATGVTVQNASGTTVAQTTTTYNTRHQVTTITVSDPVLSTSRTTTLTYCEAADIGTGGCALLGQLKTVTRPNGGVTTYAYRTSTDPAGAYFTGDLYQVTDALGHSRTWLSYDADGRPTRTADANGVITDTTYTRRGFPATLTVRANADGSASLQDATTTLGTDDEGNLTSTTDPDGVTTNVTVDSSGRLSGITDALGNRLLYGLDTAGDRTGETVKDAAGTVQRSLTRTFNTLGQLQTVVDGLGRTALTYPATDGYDGAGRPTHTIDGLGTERRQAYDGLGRLKTSTEDTTGTDPDTANAQTAFTRDALDHLTGITDPAGQVTTYSPNAYGDTLQRVSPDTGTTTLTVDSDGNPLTRTDARGVTVTSTYDAIDRIATSSYPDTTLNVTYHYDEADAVTGCSGSYPVGRLTRVIEANGTATVYCYNRLGEVTRKQLTVDGAMSTTSYTYTLAGRLSGMTYPSGAQVTYGRNGEGRINAATLYPAGGGTAVNLITGTTYEPFGPIASYTLGSGQTVTRTFDSTGQIASVSSAALDLVYNRDVEGNVTGLSGTSTSTNGFGLDALQRLKVVTDGSGTPLESYTYNTTGDRLSKTTLFQDGGTYSYASGTHQVTAIGVYARTYDAAGNTLTATMVTEPFTFRYNDRSRLDRVTRSGNVVGTYTLDAFGQRVEKVATLATAITTRFGYDEKSQLIAEQSNGTFREYVYLDQLPIAVIDTGAGVNPTATISYLHDDALGTPRVATTSTGNTIWSWSLSNNAFGEQPPVDVVGLGLNLRFAGQYYDAESGSNYNINRTYDPPGGRYLRPDPLGQMAGPSLFGYVDSNPLRYRDPTGKLIPEAFIGAGLGAAFGFVSGYINGDRGSQLWEDSISAGSAGFLIGLTDGLSLAAGAGAIGVEAGTAVTLDATAKVAISAGIGAGSEALRQKSNYGCVTSATDVWFAAALGAAGQATGGSFGNAIGGTGTALEGGASYLVTALGGITTGAVQTQIAKNESSEPSSCGCAD
jgi:RHS repeat-associated core domain